MSVTDHLPKPVGAGLSLIGRTISDFSEDGCPRMAAALAYYTVFSLPPFLTLLIGGLGTIVDPTDVRGQIEAQMLTLIGPAATDQVQTMIEGAGSLFEQDAGLRVLVSLVVLVIGATGAFAQLQIALNTAWGVTPDPRHRTGIYRLVRKRVLSLGMVLAIGFLMLVSLVVSALLSAFGNYLGDLIGGLPGSVLQTVNFVFSLAVVTLLFAALFKILPDARIRWRDVIVGAVVTAVLFTIGKFLIGLYFGHTDVGSGFGAAGSLALILIWIYYTAMLLLFGAEFTQIWAARYGGGIQPEAHAVCVVRELRYVDTETKEERSVETRKGAPVDE